MAGKYGKMKVKPQCVLLGPDGFMPGAAATLHRMERFRKHLEGCKVIIPTFNFQATVLRDLAGDCVDLSTTWPEESMDGTQVWKALKREENVHDVDCNVALVMCESFSPITREDLEVMHKAREYLEWHGARVVAGCCLVPGGIVL